MRRLSQECLIALSAALVAVALTSCATPQPQPRALVGHGTLQPDVKISPAQAKQLAQSRISFDDYEAAFRRFSACLAAKGYTLMGNGVSSNKLINYGVPDTAAQAGADEKCYVYEFQYVDGIWQDSRADTSNEAKAYAVCLRKAGIKPKATKDEKWEQLERAHIDADQCFGSQYPHGEN